jgi:hypothetical protein
VAPPFAYRLQLLFMIYLLPDELPTGAKQNYPQSILSNLPVTCAARVQYCTLAIFYGTRESALGKLNFRLYVDSTIFRTCTFTLTQLSFTTCCFQQVTSPSSILISKLAVMAPTICSPSSSQRALFSNAKCKHSSLASPNTPHFFNLSAKGMT